MLWLPTDNPDVVSIAWPLPFTLLVPSVVEPSLNVTVSVGVAPLTVAVNITDWPAVEGFCEEPTLVVDVAVKVMTICPLPVRSPWVWLTPVASGAVKEEPPPPPPPASSFREPPAPRH
jgi:hypothetical protein